MLNVVACTATLCLAGGDGSVLLRSTDDGLTWDDVGLPFSIAAVTALACPSATTCFAEGREIGTTPSGAIVATTNGGASWTGEYNETTTYLQLAVVLDVDELLRLRHVVPGHDRRIHVGPRPAP